MVNKEAPIPIHKYSKCINNCIVYYGNLKSCNECPICKMTRNDYLPGTSWSFMSPLVLLSERWKNYEIAKLLNSKSSHNYTNSIDDIWDSKLIKDLKKKCIKIDGKTLDSKHFNDNRESALGLGTDGINLFKSQSKNCWPVFLIDYLLPPSIRTKRNFILNFGIIPGPLKSKQLFHSFLEPMVDSLKLLQIGNIVYDSYRKEFFRYRGHVTHIIGDTPAISKLMGLKGTNSIYPCRCCYIKSQKGPKSVYYPTLHPPSNFRSHNIAYNSSNLPLRSHNEWLKILKKIEEDKTTSNDYGIKNRSPLINISSIIIPYSFCIDSMHLVLENVVSMTWNQLRGIGHEAFKDPNTVGS